MASIRSRGSSWQARVRRRGFPVEVKTFTSKAEAQRWAREVEGRIDAGAFALRAAANEMILRGAFDRYLVEVTPTKKGAKDEAIRMRALRRDAIASFSFSTLTPGAVADFRDRRLAAVGAGTVIRDLAVISAVINHARREWGVSTANPVALVRKPSAPAGRARTLTSEEESRLLEELQPRGRRSPWMAPLVSLALETGMRRGELLALRWEHVDLVRQTAFLPGTKNGTARAVPLSTRAVATLQALPRAASGAVFEISAMAMEAAFAKARRRAGIADLHFHDLRHTAISRMADKLPNVIELAAVSGHKSLRLSLDGKRILLGDAAKKRLILRRLRRQPLRLRRRMPCAISQPTCDGRRVEQAWSAISARRPVGPLTVAAPA